jgi:hypothetical protein
VFKNRVLRRIFGPKRKEMVGGWGKLHNDELHNLYPSPNIIRMNKLRRMKWAGDVAYQRGGRHIGFGWKSQKERQQYKDRNIDRRIILKWNLERLGWSGMDWIELAQDRDQWRALVNMVMGLQVS